MAFKPSYMTTTDDVQRVRVIPGMLRVKDTAEAVAAALASPENRHGTVRFVQVMDDPDELEIYFSDAAFREMRAIRDKQELAHSPFPIRRRYN